MGDFQWLENLSLFHHINTLDILLETSIDWVGLAVQLSVAAAAIALALVVFERRDLSY
jgi:ABC-type transport system involved in multi-copper enzyme maturation permease subunit